MSADHLPTLPGWPTVPACYGWLSLDRRGQWRLKGERISHARLIDFLNRNYSRDEHGCWLVHNGPQRVFVELAYTPWVFRLSGDGFVSHTGQPAGAPHGVWIDEEGTILLQTDLGIGLLDDRDLASFLSLCTPNDDDSVARMLAQQPHPVCWRSLTIQPIQSADVETAFGFNPKPQPA
jgi:hypothetical protein